jgi:GNAT superfamily N-acetyltransferase
MITETIIFREATAADMPGISTVRLSVKENAAMPESPARRGITNESVAASFAAASKGWVAERDGEIIAFSIADRRSRSIFALFVLPGHEGRGLGTRLLKYAEKWLWDDGAEPLWLTTDPQSRAARYYERRGWIVAGALPNGERRYELARPQSVEERE